MRLPTRPATILCGLLALFASAANAQTDVFPDLWVTDERVEGMAVLGDTLFVSGRFRYVGPPTGQLAVLDKTTGEADAGLPRVGGSVFAVLPDGAGGYFVGGAFAAVAGQPRRNLAHVRADGTLDAAFHPDPDRTGGSGIVRALVLDAGVLYVGGDFDAVAGQPRQNLAALTATTGAVLPLQATFAYPSEPSYTPRVESLLRHAGVLYVGGIFEVVSGQTRTGLAALDASTGTVLPWQANLTDENPNFLAYPEALALGDGTIYLTGGFDFVNGQRRYSTAEVSLADPVTGAGGTPTAWVPDPPGPDNLNGSDLVVIGGSVYVAASTFGGFPLARVDRATGIVTSLLAGYRYAEALAYDPDGGLSGQGTLYVGALKSTNSTGGDLYPVVVTVDPMTGQPTGFEVRGAAEDNEVRALAVEPGFTGRLFAGGTFLTFGTGVARRRGLAAFDLTTGRPTDFGAGTTDLFGGNEDLALSPDGRFLYGYSNVVGGALLRLTEFDLATGAIREFVPQNRPPARTLRRAVSGLAPARAPVPNPRVENATSAVVVTDDGAGSGRVCVSINGVACYDRATTDLLFYTPMPSVNGQGENNGDLLYLPPGGAFGVPQGAGPEGALVVAGPIEQAPAGRRQPAFVAVDYTTGAVLPSWDVGFGPTGGPEGYTLALLDRDGAGGPAAPTLYLGGDREWTVQGQARQELMAVDPTTAALQTWSPTVSGGPVFAMAAHRTAGAGGTPDGGGVVYVGGAFSFVGGERRPCCVAAFDAATGVYREDWQPLGDITFVMLASKRHEAVFLGGFGNALVTSGHVGVVAVTPASPMLPTADEAGGADAPRTASLALAGPNPLRNRTVLAVSLPEAQAVEASLFDVLGRRVAVLHSGPLPAGVSRIEVDASALPAGVYVARASGPSFTEALTLTVVR